MMKNEHELVEIGRAMREMGKENAIRETEESCSDDKAWHHDIRMKTGVAFTPLPLKTVEELACDELYLKVHVRTGEEEYDCDRAGHHTCYGKGWCPLRFTAPWYTPRIDPKDGHWRYY